MEYTWINGRVKIEAPEVPLEGLVFALAREAYQLKVEQDPISQRLGSSSLLHDDVIRPYVRLGQEGLCYPTGLLLQMDYVSGQPMGLTVETDQGAVFLRANDYVARGGNAEVLLDKVRSYFER